MQNASQNLGDIECIVGAKYISPACRPTGRQDISLAGADAGADANADAGEQLTEMAVGDRHGFSWNEVWKQGMNQRLPAKNLLVNSIKSAAALLAMRGFRGENRNSFP